MIEQYDAVIIGSGTNGLAAAIRLQQLGLSTMIVEGASSPGGSTRTEELTLPGFKHDVGSSIHPLGVESPFFKSLPLHQHGLEWVYPEIAFAHPFSDGSAYGAFRNIGDTAAQMGKDENSYTRLFQGILKNWNNINEDLLGPLGIPENPLEFASFGLKALLPAKELAKLYFRDEKTRIFFYGAAAHSTLPLTAPASASFGLVLSVLAHKAGWPFPKYGAVKIVESLISYYKSLGGKLALDFPVKNINELPKSTAYIFDLTPRQLLAIEGTDFPWLYRKRMENYKYGAGIFKMDWALHEPIPFKNELLKKAGTIHIGWSCREIEKSEKVIHRNGLVKEPYILMAQHSRFDSSRAPDGKHTAWAYCHVPLGSDVDMSSEIENGIEKAAPGFRDCILARKTHTTSQMEAFNPNLVGGDINGGKQDITQLFTRPITRVSPYSTPNPKIYICSSSTPPGGGVHGMSGFHAAGKVLNDHFPGLSE